MLGDSLKQIATELLNEWYINDYVDKRTYGKLMMMRFFYLGFYLYNYYVFTIMTL